MIKIENLCKKYDTNAGSVEALKDINLELPDTGMIFLVGKSGCGKSTLLNILGGIDKPTTGEINVDGNIINSTNGHSLDEYRNRVVGFVFQEFNLLDEYNVYDNVAIALNLRGEKEINNKVAQALDKVGLAGYEKRRTNELSGGQKQRVAIARAIVAESKILLADEPTGNLDSATAKELFDLFRELSKNQLVFIVTHDEENANKYADRIIRISDGKIASDELKNQIEDFNKKEEQDLSKDNFQEGKHKSINISQLTKFGFINVWKKKWRMLVTIILSCFTFTIFGMGIAAARYNPTRVTLNTLYEQEVNEFKVELVSFEDNKYKFQNDKVAELQEKFPSFKFNAFYEPAGYAGGEFEEMYEELKKKKMQHIPIQETVIDQTILDYYGYKMIVGRLPQEVNELCISKLLADWIIENGLLFYNDEPVRTYEDILAGKYNKKIVNHYLKYKIVGIVETYANDYLDKIQVDNIVDSTFESMVKNPQLYNSYSYAFMYNKSYFDNIYDTEEKDLTGERKASFGYYGIGEQKQSESLYISERYMNTMVALGDYCVDSSGENYIIDIVRRNDNAPLKYNEVMISTRLFRELVYRVDPSFYPTEYNMERSKELIEENTFWLEYTTFNTGPEKLQVILEVAGVYESGCTNSIIISDELSDKISEKNIVSINTKLSGNRERDELLVEEFLKPNYTLQSFCSQDLYVANTLSSNLAKIGIYTALALGIFTSIMMANFIITSINDSKKQIGVLRSLGMKTSGIIYIFMIETMIIVLLSFIISAALLFPCSHALSSYYSYFAIYIPVLLPDFVAVSLMLALGVGIGVISTIFPIIKKAKTPPGKLIKEL